jgi:hypothetical protein
MTTLPNADRAIVPLEKLRDYSLSPVNAEGTHKARVFAAALGLRQGDAEWLQRAIFESVAQAPCRPGPSSQYGAKYVVDVVLSRAGKEARVRTAWLVPNGQEVPRLVSAYVLPSKAWESAK